MLSKLGELYDTENEKSQAFHYFYEVRVHHHSEAIVDYHYKITISKLSCIIIPRLVFVVSPRFVSVNHFKANVFIIIKR